MVQLMIQRALGGADQAMHELRLPVAGHTQHSGGKRGQRWQRQPFFISGPRLTSLSFCQRSKAGGSYLRRPCAMNLRACQDSQGRAGVWWSGSRGSSLLRVFIQLVLDVGGIVTSQVNLPQKAKSSRWQLSRSRENG
jgi:hypothetical protein